MIRQEENRVKVKYDKVSTDIKAIKGHDPALSNSE